MLTRLRSFTLSLVLCLASYVCSAQWVAIPDSNFGKWLNTNGYSACLQGNSTSGWQMDTTCNQVVSATKVDCGGQPIRNLSGIEYFDSMDSLVCYYDSCSLIPALPNNLTYVNCGDNLLTLLPALPQNLTKLDCYRNQLTSLPSLPAGVISLNCHKNALNILPTLPQGLVELSCMDNQLTELPSLPKSLRVIFCGYNQLTAIPELPDTLNFFTCDGNSQLYCLPRLKTIEFIFFDSTGVTCLPNYPNGNFSSIPSLDSFPLCSFFNSNHCPVFWNIGGQVFYDSIADCNIQTSEPIYSNLKLNLYNGGNLVQQTFTNNYGSYSFDVNSGTYTYSLDTTNIPFSVGCPAAGFRTSTITALDSMDFSMDFGLRCKPGFDLIAQSIEAIFRPGTVSQVNVLAGDASAFYNAHCAAGTSGAVTVTINGSAHYTAPANGALTPTVNGNTLTYSIADFGVVDFFHAFNIMVQTDTNAVLGSQICITVTVTPTTGDNNPANNTLTICFPVVGSFDPNDKTAYPAGDIDTAQKEITYTVRFQNTGTAEAQHIYITDTLDTDIDEGSFQLLAYSHQPMVQIEQNRVRFNFPNINLPDSNTNEPLSHGYVQYKVKLKDNLPIGTQINNTAHIYFDFNAPVVTNTTSNTITTNTAVAEVRSQVLDFRLSPNPTRDAFSVTVPETLVGKMLLVTDATGRAVFQSKISNLKSEISVSSLSDGLYLVKVGNTVKRLIIRR